jgi:putative nucleotidyltransferase with HDIG domain
MDISTLFATSALSSIASAAIMLVIYRTRRTYDGFGWWTLGMMFFAAGAALFMPAISQNNGLVLLTRNTCLVIGLWLILRGLVLYRGHHLPRRFDALIIGSFVLLFGYFSFAPDSLDERIVVYSTYAATIAAAIVAVTLRQRPSYFGSADRLLAGSLALFVLLSVYRVGLHALGNVTTGEFVEQQGFQGVYVLTQILVVQLIVLSLISINTQRIEHEYTDARAEIAGYISGLEKGMKATLDVVNNMMKLRDPFTAGHEERVSAIAREIALEMGWTRDHAEMIAMIGTIHDVGKIGVPAEILSRPGKLSDLEYDLVKSHAELGYEITKDIQFPIPVGEIIRSHHERLDGSGYPRGLKGDQILPETRVLMVADALESMTSHRPYRAAMSIDDAKADLMGRRGSQYDPAVVDAALNMIEQHGNKLPV